MAQHFRFVLGVVEGLLAALQERFHLLFVDRVSLRLLILCDQSQKLGAMPVESDPVHLRGWAALLRTGGSGAVIARSGASATRSDKPGSNVAPKS